LLLNVYKYIDKAALELSNNIIDNTNNYTIKTTISEIQHTCSQYRKTRMINKYMLPILIDFFINACDTIEGDTQLFNFNDIMQLMSYDENKSDDKKYIFYPYINTPQELSFALMCYNITGKRKWLSQEEICYKIKELYKNWNYLIPPSNDVSHPSSDIIKTSFDEKQYALDQVNVSRCNDKYGKTNFAVKIESSIKNMLCVAIGNSKVDSNNIYKVLQNKPNRTYERYSEIMSIINQAIQTKADILVLPECYIPFEWIPAVSRICAKQRMALITGIEHIIQPKSKIDIENQTN
jgi:hypothetical protein